MKYKFVDEGKQHLHTLDEKPLIGTSTVVGVLGKPGLVWWSAGMALSALGWTNPKYVPKEEGIKIAGKARRNFFISNSEYYEWLQECYKAHNTRKNEAAVGGTDMHSRLEAYVKGCIEQFGGKPQILKEETPFISDFAKWAVDEVDTFLVSEAHTFSERLWCGGITDCVAIMKDGKVAIIDFKSSKEAYESQFIQIAGYDIQMRENGCFDANGGQLKPILNADEYIVIPFGAEEFKPVFRFNTEQLRRNFESALDLYKTVNQI